MTDPVLVREDRAAELLSVSPRKVREWASTGIVPSVKIGGLRLYSPDALREWALMASRASSAAS